MKDPSQFWIVPCLPKDHSLSVRNKMVQVTQTVFSILRLQKSRVFIGHMQEVLGSRDQNEIFWRLKYKVMETLEAFSQVVVDGLKVL